MRESIEIFREHEMANSAAGVRRCLGLVIGGEEGREFVDAADAELVALGIRNPARLTATWLPGFEGTHDGPSPACAVP
jgi:hypothetical protein